MSRMTLLLAALLVAALAFFVPSPATAQELLPQRAVPGLRLLGAWRDGNGLAYTIEETHMARVKGTVVRPATGEVVATFELSPHATEGVRGPFTDLSSGQTGVLSAYHNGQSPVFFVREGTFLGRTPSTGFQLAATKPASADAAAQAWIGTWRTSRGLLHVNADQKSLFGELMAGDPAMYVGGVAFLAEGNDAYGGWEGNGMGDVSLRLSADRNRFSGYYTDLKTGRTSRLDWTGERVARPAGRPDAPLTTSDPTPPVPASPTGPTAPPPVATPTTPVATPASGAPAAPAAFQPLRRVDVRLDRLVEARGYPTRQVHAFVTLKNISSAPQYISSGYLRAVLEDGAGGIERNQVWRADGEPAALFDRTPVVQPGGELKVRYVFNASEGSTPTLFRLSEGDKVAEFPAGRL